MGVFHQHKAQGGTGDREALGDATLVRTALFVRNMESVLNYRWTIRRNMEDDEMGRNLLVMRILRESTQD